MAEACAASGFDKLSLTQRCWMPDICVTLSLSKGDASTVG
jgi:hypothetical protein